MSAIYFDASTVFRAGIGPTTGIPRYERQMVQAALLDTAAGVGICVFDHRLNILRGTTDEEDILLKEIIDDRKIYSRLKEHYWNRLLWASGIVSKNSIGKSRQFERSVAAILSGGNSQRGLIYSLSKTLIRSIRYVRSTAKLLSGKSEVFPDLLLSGDAKIFLSNQTIPIAAQRMDSGEVRAQLYTVMYDTIPLDFPQFFESPVKENFLPAFLLAIKNSTGIICISEHTRARVQHWCDKFNIHFRSVCVAPTSSQLVEKTTELALVPEVFGREFILYCSTVEPRKNHLMILNIWKEKLASNPKRWPTVVFCGKKGWLCDPVFEFMDSNPEVAQHVLFMHDVSDPQLGWLYQNSLFSIFPSFEEGWGLGASESLDFGTPVIISKAPALVEATQGLMPAIDVSDFAGWMAKIEHLVASPSARQELRSRIIESYRRTTVTVSFENVLNYMRST